MKRIIACTLSVLATILVYGQSVSDSVKVYFNISQWQYDPALGDNAASMDDFIESVRIANETHNLDSVIIRSYSSPDGPDRFNQRLAVKRGKTIAGLIADRTGINHDLISTIPNGVSWVELRRLVADTPDVPSREKILDIIDNTPIWVFDTKGRIIDGRKKQLMELRGGRPYNWMLKHLFPKLRSAVAVSLCVKNAINPDERIADSTCDTNRISQTPASFHPFVIEQTDETTYEPVDTLNLIKYKCAPPEYRFSLKTNMLYYAALLPNIEIEWLINNHWSVALEGNFASWGSYKRQRSYRLTLLDAEGKYWIKPRAAWHGMYVGLIAGGGWYDLEKGSPGHYGWGTISGLSLGYMWPIGRSLSLEAGVGVGYMYTRYKDYEPIEGHHVYLRTKDIHYFGPIKLNFSIAWRFMEVKKHKLTTPAL